MIKKVHYLVNGIDFVKTYSDNNMMIHGGSPDADYSEACDPANLGRTYTETDIPIEDDTTAEELLSILTGGES